MRTIPVLTRDNCTLVVLHSMNVRLMLDGLKDFEGRDWKVSRDWVVFVSARKDNPGPLKWVSDPTIKKGYMYIVAYVLGFSPGVDFKWHWSLEVYPLEHPVGPCKPVGRGPQLPREEHSDSMLKLNANLALLQISMSASNSRVWTFEGAQPTAFKNTSGSKEIPLAVLHCYNTAVHNKRGALNAGDVVWYAFTTRDPIDVWKVPEGHDRIQVMILSHCYFNQNPVRFVLVHCML